MVTRRDLDLASGMPILIGGFVVGIAVRVWVILHGVEVADVQHLHNIGRYFLAGNDPYRLPPFESNFPPIALLLEASAELASRFTNVPFQITFKIWPLAADVGTGLVIFALLLHARLSRRRAAVWSALFLLNPVSILITAAHGNLDPVTNFLSVLALALIVRNPKRLFAWSALALGVAIGIKPNPVLLLPILAGYPGLSIRQRVLFVVITALPAGLTFIPFFLDTPAGVIGNVFGYTGELDFGYGAILRIAWYFKTGGLHLPGTVPLDLVSVTRLTFGLAYLALLAYGVGRMNPARLVTSTYLLFYVLFTGQSAQYAVWIVPFAILAGDWFVLAYSAAALFGLVGFYSFFFPQILFGDLTWFPDQLPINAPLYAGGILAMWGFSTLWLVVSVAFLRIDRRERSGLDALLPDSISSRRIAFLGRFRPVVALLAVAGCLWTLVSVFRSVTFVIDALRG